MKLFVGSVINLRRFLFDEFEDGLRRESTLPATFTTSNVEMMAITGDTATLLKAGQVQVTATISNPDGAIVTLPEGISVTILDPLPAPAKKVGTKLVDVLGE